MHVIKQTGTANTTYSPGRKIKYLAIHYTAGVSCKAGSASGSASWFSNPDAGGAADYIVDEGGLVQYNPDPWNRYCHAVGGGRYATKGGRLYGVAKNSNCVSLEICSGNRKGKITYPNDPDYYFSTAVIAKAIEATQYIMDLYGIDADHVIRHYDVNGKCCLPIDRTELLTPNGWVSLGSVRIGMSVAQYYTEKDSITFAPVLDVVEPREELVLKNRYLEATADHRMWLKPNCKNSQNFREVLWGDALNGKKQYVIKTAGYLETDGIDLTDNELRLLVWIQADGHYMIEKRKEKGQGIYGIEFHVSKERKISRILELFDSMDIPYNLNSCKNGSVHIRTYEKWLYHWAETWLTNKVFNYNLIWMNQHQFEVFWEELVQADGSIEGQLYTSSIDHNNDVVQAICALHGKRSSKISMGKGGENTVLTAITNHTVGIGNSTLPIKKRNTMVSCVTVPSGFILVRNNNRTFIVGNCPGVIGWNADSGSETAWEAFHKSIGGSPIVWYRVRYAWDQPATQLDAFTDLGRAKACADAHPGFSVYDGDGKCLYTSKPKPIKELTAKNLTGTEEQKIKQVAPIYQEVMKDTGMLASVGLAQFCLESGYGTTDLAKEANNMHGMKCSLSGNTWDGSVWDGHSSYGKYSPEVYNGKTAMVYSEFRKYPSIYKSVQDRAAYFIGAWLDAAKTKHRYPNVNMIKNAEEQVRLLKAGGYATDPNYVSKLLSIISRFNLTQYDDGITPDAWDGGEVAPKPEPKPSPSPSANGYRVRVGIYKKKKYLEKLRQKIKDALDLDCFTEPHEDGTHVFCGSFSSKENAKTREKILNDAGFDTKIIEC